MNQVLLEPDDLLEDGTARLTGRRLRHALEVLRAEEGDVLPAAASLGVDRIVLVNAARVEKSYFALGALRAP